MKAALSVVLMLVAGCAAQGPFPSLNPRPGEVERVIAEPGAGQSADLSAEERQSVAADVARARVALAKAGKAIAEAQKDLEQTLPAARRATAGSEPWARAQMMLSRLQDARGALAGIDAGLAPGLLLSDGLPDADPDRAALRATRAAIAAEDARSAAVAAAAEASLAR